LRVVRRRHRFIVNGIRHRADAAHRVVRPTRGERCVADRLRLREDAPLLVVAPGRVARRIVEPRALSDAVCARVVGVRDCVTCGDRWAHAIVYLIVLALEPIERVVVQACRLPCVVRLPREISRAVVPVTPVAHVIVIHRRLASQRIISQRGR